MTDIEEITKRLVEFRNERDWEQFHNSKNLSLAISVEASELLELFLWKKTDSADKQKIKEELADIFAYAFLLAEKQGFNVKEIVLEKIIANGVKYPIEKAKGTEKKYNQF
jgi:NTP pyrophosphatase (non-canonical NTP hydrolase)